jgi:hypothetical protein
MDQRKINSHETKKNYDVETIEQICDYLFSTINLTRFNYTIIELESQLSMLYEKHYFVSPNYSGNNCLLIFTKIKNKFISCMINRKTLAYTKEKTDIKNLEIYPVNIKLDKNVYDGTIIDGTFTHNVRAREKMFIITDIYYLKGKKLVDASLKCKYHTIQGYIENNLKKEESTDLKFLINKLYPITYDNIIKIKSDCEQSMGISVKGYTFYPNISNTKLIFLNQNGQTKFKKVDEIKNNNIINTSLNKVEEKKIIENKKPKIKYICKTDEPIYATLDIRKTDSVDCYNVFCYEKLDDNKIKLKKLGTAYIKDKDTSFICRTILEHKKGGKALMKCVYNQKMDKWEPLEEEKIKKLPDDLNYINKFFTILIDSDEDSE